MADNDCNDMDMGYVDEPLEPEIEVGTTSDVGTTINTMLNQARARQQPTPKQTSRKDYISDALRQKYSSLERVGHGIRSNDEWSNSYLLTLEHLNIVDYQGSDIKTQSGLAKTAINSLAVSVSPQSAGCILATAWLLKSPEDPTEFVFHPVDMVRDSKKIVDLPIDSVASGENSEIKFPSTDLRLIKEASFICAAMIRMVTKEAKNIKNAWGSLRRSYSNFYQEEMSLTFDPHINCLEGIRNLLQNRLIIKNTVAPFLLNLVRLEGQNKGICNILFGIDLSYTGMHSYKLLLFCASRLGIETQVLIQLLKHPAHAPALKLAEKLLADYDFPDKTPEAKEKAANASTWKYARIFNHHAFATLQTKNCSQLTALLAVIAKKVGTATSGDATRIKEISNLLTQSYDWFEEKADRIIALAVKK